MKSINWATGKYAVLHEDGDTIYHTLDELRLFNKSFVCGKIISKWIKLITNFIKFSTAFVDQNITKTTEFCLEGKPELN